MGIRFYCPQGHKLNVKAFQAGKLGICPECGARVRIPMESTRPSRRELREQADEVAESVIPEVGISSEAPEPSVSIEEVALPDTQIEPVLDGAESAAPKTPEPTPVPMSQPAPEPPAIPAPPAPASQDPLDEDPGAVWYVRPPAGGQYGPASATVMRNWIDEGRVGDDALIWRDGWPEWQKASDVFHQAPSPAPAPMAAPSALNIDLDDSGGQPQLQLNTTTGNAVAAQTSRKNSGVKLIVGLTIAVLVLAGVFVWVLLRDSGGGDATEETPAAAMRVEMG